MPSTTIKYFAFAHLPPKLQAVSKPLGELAEKLEALLQDGPEKSAGMRKLLEAKDCFVRCAIDMPEPVASTVPPTSGASLMRRPPVTAKSAASLSSSTPTPFSPSCQPTSKPGCAASSM